MTSPTDPPASPPATDDEVPKLPRGRGLTLSTPQIVRIVGMIAVLVFLLVMQKPCANGISKFVTSYGSAAGSGQPGAGSAGSAAHGSELDQYERLRPGMSDAEVKAVIERARHKADPAGGAAAGSGSAAP